jgi:lysyl-tRNA synthetase class 1
MSTSKGRGAAAHEIADVVPPEQLRFLFNRPRPNQAIEFDPVGTDAIPRLFDEFDRLAAATAGREVRGELPSGYANVFRYSLLSPDADVATEARAFRPAFSHLALLLQVPNVDVLASVTAEKGSDLTERELAILDERKRAAEAWLEAYAPDSARMAVRRDALPDEATELAAAERSFLATLAERAERERPASGDEWQGLIFTATKELGVSPKAAFAALYLAFLGRPNGPRAGWLLASLEPGFVATRLREAAGAGAVGTGSTA